MWTGTLGIVTFIYFNEFLGVIGKYLIHSIKYINTYKKNLYYAIFSY